MLFSHHYPFADVKFPEFRGIRVMMMPFILEDPKSLPPYLSEYGALVKGLDIHEKGVGYITIDEAVLKAGEHHRRPGLHVDGGYERGWGGGGGGWGARGMLVAISKPGCRMYDGIFMGEPDVDGGCEHLRGQLPPGKDLEPHRAYWVGPHAIHETTPQTSDGPRQFLRISMPSDSPWFEGYTPNPLGIMPTGPILPARTKQMAYRP